MKTYLYPQNLKARANLWLWSLRDFVILCAAVLVSAVIFLNYGYLLPAALALCFGFLCIVLRFLITVIRNITFIFLVPFALRNTESDI